MAKSRHRVKVQRKSRNEALKEVINVDSPVLSFSKMARASKESQAQLASDEIKTALKKREWSYCQDWARSWDPATSMFRAWARRIRSEDLGSAAYLSLNRSRFESDEQKETVDAAYRNIMALSGYVSFMEKWAKLFRGLFLGFVFFVVVAGTALLTGRGEETVKNKDYLLDFFLEFPIAFGLVVLFFVSVAPYLIRR